MITKLIVYLKKSGKKYDAMEYFAEINKNSNFPNFYCISTAVIIIILYGVWQLERGRIISFYI